MAVNVLFLSSLFLIFMSDHRLPLSRYQAMVTAPLTVEGTVSVQIALVALARSREALTPGTPKDWRHALRTRCLVVVDGDRQVRGLLTALDGLRLLTQDPPLDDPLDQCPVEQVMTPISTQWREAALPPWPEMVAALGAGQPIPVVDNQDRLVGLVGAESVAAVATGGQADAEPGMADRVAVLQDRETRYQALMDRASDAIMIADLEGHILEANRQAEKLLGYSRAELTAMHFTQLHPPEDLPRIVVAFEQLANQQACQVIDVNCRRRDGQVVTVDISASVISLPDRPIIQGIFRDVRERKAIEQALRQSEAQYRQIVDTANEGIWVIDAEGHTLVCNPALAQSLGLDQDSLVGQSLFQFVDEADRPDLEIHFQRHRQGQGGQYELPLRSRDGTQRIMLASVSPRVDESGTHTGLTSSPGFTPGEDVNNLLNNAMKFTPEGGEITLRADLSSDGQVQPFVQIDSALNRQYPGTGLGLALVKQIVDLHGGTVSLTSTVGVGSCFTLNLPLDPSAMVFDAPLDMTDLTDPVSSLSSAAALPPLILLAEDNETNILTLTSYLEAKGYRLRVVNNGQDAVAVALAENPDLVLMDIQMPVMDGLTAIQKIRQTRPLATLPIIALTALAMEGDRERCFQAGANDYLSKPVKLRELLELIQSLLPVANA